MAKKTSRQSKQSDIEPADNGFSENVFISEEAMMVIPRSFNLHMALEQAIYALWQYTQAPTIALFALAENEQRLRLVAGRGFTDAALQVGQTLPLEGSLSGLAVLRREIVTSDTLAEDDRLEPTVKAALMAQGLHYVVSIPLLFQEGVIGVVNLIYAEKAAAALYDEAALQFMAQSIGSVMVGLHDLQQVQRVEEALRKSEAQFRGLAESSPDYIFVLDLLSFKTLYANRDDFLGYPRDEWRDRSVFDHVHPDDREIMHTFFREFVDRLVEGDVPTIEYRLATKEGQWEWVQHRGAVFTTDETGRPTQVTIMLTVVSGRKWAEDALRQSEERYRHLYEQLQDLLARRGRQVALSTQVAQEVASATHLDDLYRRVVEQIQDQFGFYHTQLLLLDPAEEVVKLIHGYGAVGERMRATGHQLPVGVGLIGVAAASGESVLRLDVAADPNWLPNPLLPGTKGELAIPIKLKDKVLGVLDVQTDQAHQLSTEDQLLLEGLCGQVAIAIENTRLLEEANIFRQFVESSTQGMGFTRLDGLVTYANPALLKMGGYTADDVVGRPALQYYPENIHPIVTHDVPRAILQGESWEGELAIRGFDGRIIPTYESFFPLLDRQGKPRYIADLVTDMTERKQAELDLQERLVELNHLQRYMSKEGWQTFHAAANERPQGFIFDQRSVQPVPGTHSNGADHHETVNAPLNSQTTQTVITPLFVGGETIGLLGIETDLSAPLSADERSLLDEISIQVAGALENARLSEQTQLALAGQEKLSAQLGTVAEVSAIASTILEEEQLLQAVVDLTKIQFSIYHAQIFIYDENTQRLRLRAGSDQVGRLMVYEKYTLALSNQHSPVTQAATTRKPVVEADIQAKGMMVHPYLSETCSQLAIPILQGEKLLGVIDLHANTPGYFTEEDIRVYTTLSLQVAVALQNAYLYAEQLQTAEQLREVDRLKSEFLASMSHELRTPLNSVVGFADVLLEGLDGELNERMEEDVRLIRQSGIHLRELISDILDMSKIEAGMMELRFEEIYVREIAEEMIATNKPVAQTNKKHLDLQLEIRPDVTNVVADRTRLRQIFHNLISNAIKFTERGFVRIAISKREDDLLVAVQDSGIGIRAEDTSIVFERFRQIDGSLTRQAGGTGLGMPITKELVELHGGRIWLESQVGEGTTFWFTIPLYQQVKKRHTAPLRDR